MNTVFCLLLLASAAYSIKISGFEVEEEGGIALLESRRFGVFKYKFPFFVNYFYYTNSSQHEEILSELSKAAIAMNETYPGVRFGKMDAILNESYVGQYSVTENDTIRLFVKISREGTKYEGPIVAEDIIKWLKEHIYNSLVHINELEEAKNYTKENEDVVFYLGPKSSENFEKFLGVVSKFNEHNLTFAVAENESIKQEFGVANNEDTVILSRSFREEISVFIGAFDVDSLVKFVQIHKYPVISPYNKKARMRLQYTQEDAIVLFKGNDEKGEKAFQEFTAFAEANRGRIVCLFEEAGIDPKLSFGRSTAGYLNLKEEDYPRLAIIQGSGEAKKYLLDPIEVTQSNIEEFVTLFNERRIKPYYRSEPLPANEYDGDIQVIVGKNFKEVVSNNDKDVLVAFYSPECPYSKAFFKTYTKVAAKLNRFEDLVLAKVNVDRNEFEDFQVLGVPSLKFYPRGRKSNPISLSQPSLGSMIKMLRKYSSIKISQSFIDEIASKKKKLKESIEFSDL